MGKYTFLLVGMAAAACGGSDSNTSDDWESLMAICATPRSGVDPLSNQPYPDKQGTLSDEKKFLRAMIDDLYLWYSEVPNLDPNAYPTAVDYFEALRTPALLPSGKIKDPNAFHFNYPTPVWEQIEQSIEAGYGVDWAVIQTTRAPARHRRHRPARLAGGERRHRPRRRGPHHRRRRRRERHRTSTR